MTIKRIVRLRLRRAALLLRHNWAHRRWLVRVECDVYCYLCKKTCPEIADEKFPLAPSLEEFLAEIHGAKR